MTVFVPPTIFKTEERVKLKNPQSKNHCIPILPVIGILFTTFVISASSIGDMNHFLAGVILLNGNNKLSQEEKTQQFRKLGVITGVSGQDAKKFVESYRNRPEEWKKIYESIVDIFSESNKPGN